MAYALNSAAFLSETLRASVSGVGAGQQEAAYSVGLTKVQSLVYVILPQTIRISIPGIANSLSSLLKDTFLAYSAAGILDIMGMASTNASAAFRDQSGSVLSATFREIVTQHYERLVTYHEKFLTHYEKLITYHERLVTHYE